MFNDSFVKNLKRSLTSIFGFSYKHIINSIEQCRPIFNIYKFQIYYNENINDYNFIDAINNIINDKTIYIFKNTKILNQDWKADINWGKNYPIFVGYIDDYYYTSEIETVNNQLKKIISYLTPNNINWRIQFGDTDIIATLIILNKLKYHYVDLEQLIDNLIQLFIVLYEVDFTQFDSFQEGDLNRTIEELSKQKDIFNLFKIY